MLNGNLQHFCPPDLGHHLLLRVLRTLSFLLLALRPCLGLAANATVSQAQAQTAEGSEVSTLMGILETQLRLKQGTAAQQSAQKLATLLAPTDPRFFQLANLCAIHGDYATAIPLLERVRAAFPQSYDVNYNLSLAYLRNKNQTKAAETLQILVKQHPRAEAYNLLAVVQEQRQQYLEAVRAYQKAAELEPGNENYRFDYAFELLKHKTDRPAVAIFASGVRDFPRSLKLHLGLGCTYFVVGKQEEAAGILLKAIRIEPNNRLAYRLLGKTYEQSASLRAAVEEAFRVYLEKLPADPWAHYYYARILTSIAQSTPKPDFEKAKTHLQRALGLNPRFAEAYVQLAILLQTEDQNQESLPLLARAVEYDPRLAAAHYRLGLAYRRLGKKVDATREFGVSEKLNAETQSDREKRTVIQFLIEQEK
jgi:tetratricopeptide (TPR) repeat protein